MTEVVSKINVIYLEITMNCRKLKLKLTIHWLIDWLLLNIQQAVYLYFSYIQDENKFNNIYKNYTEMCQQLLTATEKESCVGTKNLRLL
jgi:hypothetical protein